jgi:hypothetical protein
MDRNLDVSALVGKEGGDTTAEEKTADDAKKKGHPPALTKVGSMRRGSTAASFAPPVAGEGGSENLEYGPSGSPKKKPEGGAPQGVVYEDDGDEKAQNFVPFAIKKPAGHYEALK